MSIQLARAPSRLSDACVRARVAAEFAARGASSSHAQHPIHAARRPAAESCAVLMQDPSNSNSACPRARAAALPRSRQTSPTTFLRSYASLPNIHVRRAIELMSDRDKHVGLLFTAELQFRLASAVRLATTLEQQPLNIPIEWTHGAHRVTYEDMALRQDQADYAACFLHRSATFLLAVAIKDAVRAVVPDPKNSPDTSIRAAYQIARLVRNAFIHAPFAPTWSIDPDCRGREFVAPDVATLNTTGLHEAAFDWRHYGGPLALFRLCRFTRTKVLNDVPPSRKVVPIPLERVYQQGDLIPRAVEELPPGVVPLDTERLPDGGLALGDGHVLYPAPPKSSSTSMLARRRTSACSRHVKVSRILRGAKCATLCHAADARR